MRDLGRIDGLDEYIEKQLAEKQKIIDKQQATIEEKDKEIAELKTKTLKKFEKATEKLNKQLQKEKGEKINAEEKLSYMIWKYNKLKQKNFDLQVKLSEVMENED